jgi:hypothetical protein
MTKRIFDEVAASDENATVESRGKQAGTNEINSPTVRMMAMSEDNLKLFETLNGVVLPLRYPKKVYDELLEKWSSTCFLGLRDAAARNEP